MYVYLLIHICIYLYTLFCIICIYIYTNIYIYVCIYIYMMYIFIYVYVQCVWACAGVFFCAHCIHKNQSMNEQMCDYLCVYVVPLLFWHVCFSTSLEGKWHCCRSMQPWIKISRTFFWGVVAIEDG